MKATEINSPETLLEWMSRSRRYTAGHIARLSHHPTDKIRHWLNNLYTERKVERQTGRTNDQPTLWRKA